jgi:uncharacterized HAD superfamily protein
MAKIGIDMDDVLCNFQKRFVALLNGMYGRPTIGTDPTDWDWSNCQVSKDEMSAAWAKAATVWNLWEYLEPLPSFDYDTFSLLRSANARHDVFFVTNRFPTLGKTPMKQTKAWLHNVAGILQPNVMLAKDKGPMASVLELDAFLDDRPKNCLDVLAARPAARVYLCNSSHNQPFSDPRIPRVKDLKEFLNLILEAN